MLMGFVLGMELRLPKTLQVFAAWPPLPYGGMGFYGLNANILLKTGLWPFHVGIDLLVRGSGRGKEVKAYNYKLVYNNSGSKVYYSRPRVLLMRYWPCHLLFTILTTT
jgi:hypothetical protein